MSDDSIVYVTAAPLPALDEPVRGFQGWRRRWCDYADERPFPTWRTGGVA